MSGKTISRREVFRATRSSLGPLTPQVRPRSAGEKSWTRTVPTQTLRREAPGHRKNTLSRHPDPSATPRDDGGCASGFTLIELLVVIAVIALLMGILLPVLARVRKQARAVACQATLRQWGLAFHTYAAANDGRLPACTPEWGWFNVFWTIEYPRDCEELLLCPSARRPSDDTIPPGMAPGTTWAPGIGSPFRAWRHGYLYEEPDHERLVVGSYGVNTAIGWENSSHPYTTAAWQTPDAKGASRAPIFFDCAEECFGTRAPDPLYDEEAGIGRPPERTDFFLKPRKNEPTYWVCMDRHARGINVAFLDASVRKVDLKELWTLKWHRWYNTANRWTRAGGVQPGDWPDWMRQFKEY